MSVYRQFLGILNRNGTTVTLRHGGQEYAVQAYIATLPFYNRQYILDRCSIIGSGNQNLFLYLGAPENGGELVCEGDLIVDGGDTFVVSVCEPRSIAGKPFYMWGILRRANEEAEHV